MKFSWPGIIIIVAAILLFLNGYRRGFIKEIVSTVFIFLAIAIVGFINPHIDRFLRENTPVYKSIEKTCTDIISGQTGQLGEQVSLSVNQQMGILEKLNLPDVIKNLIKENNNAETYNNLGVNDFVGYISAYLANLIMKGISFLISFLLATILIRTASFVLNIFAKLPVINGVNRLLGGFLGLVKLLIFVWIAMVVVLILCNTEPGKMLLEMINSDKVLTWMYNHNLIARIFHLV